MSRTIDDIRKQAEGSGFYPHSRAVEDVKLLLSEIDKLRVQASFEDGIHREFIDKVWEIVRPDDDDWDYPSQVLRYTRYSLDDARRWSRSWKSAAKSYRHNCK